MTDIQSEQNSNSKSNLIEVQHVGVTAKIPSPLKSLLLDYSSSTETDNNPPLYRGSHPSNTAKYNKFQNDMNGETDNSIMTDTSRVLYEMKAMTKQKPNAKLSLTPSKIEFQLYTKSAKRLKKSHSSSKPVKKQTNRKLFASETKGKDSIGVKETPNVFKRLLQTFENIKASNLKTTQQPAVDTLLPDLNKPFTIPQPEVRIGIYPFDHGCAEYLQTHDSPPQIVSILIADKASEYATKFWAEFFGTLYIGVAFIVTFLLQSYRFVLYSLINTLLVGFLHMTSDYLFKPILSVIFNGFLQPPLIFALNILCSLRDVVEPVAEALNYMMKPIATVARNIRLVHATYNKKNITKNV